MISSDLTRQTKTALKTALGQLNYILKQVDNAQKATDILLQLKAVQAMLNKISFELLDETYRKALAEKLVANHEACPGNCGWETNIQEMLKLFPTLQVEDIPAKLKEAELIQTELKKIITEKNLDTPLPPL